MKYIIKSQAIKNNCIKEILSLPAEPIMQVVIEPYKKKRSIDSNSLYWLWLKVISDFTGYTQNELHDKFRMKFLPIVEKEVKFKNEVVLLRELTSTKDLNSNDFSKYMMEIEMLAISEPLNIALPYPDDLTYTLRSKQ